MFKNKFLKQKFLIRNSLNWVVERGTLKKHNSDTELMLNFEQMMLRDSKTMFFWLEISSSNTKKAN